MKSILFAVLLIGFSSLASADDPSYRTRIDAAHRRLGELIKQFGLGKIPPAAEKEKFTLYGQLMLEDPVWALQREIGADINALGNGKLPTPEEAAQIGALRQLQGIVGEFSQRATTVPEAESFASILRQFVVRRDVDGARTWAKAQ